MKNNNNNYNNNIHKYINNDLITLILYIICKIYNIILLFLKKKKYIGVNLKIILNTYNNLCFFLGFIHLFK